MAIKVEAYQANKESAIKQLDQYTVKKVPTLTNYAFKEVSFVTKKRGTF